MAKKTVLLLIDVPFDPPKDHHYSEYLVHDYDWKAEWDVYKALKRLGYSVKVFGIFVDIHPLIEEIKNNPPDLIFNLCESFQDSRDHEPNMAALFELLNINYTGADPASMRLCKDKGLTKKLLVYHGIRVPEFEISKRDFPLGTLRNFSFPAIVKPLELEASEGITRASLVKNEKEALEQIKSVHDKFESDVIIEEYIEGRELYVGVLGDKDLTVFPPRELYFDKFPKGRPRFASYKVKWDYTYRDQWGIRNGMARRLTRNKRQEIEAFVRKAYLVLDLKGYVRFDLRLSEEGEIVLIEVNPNPSINRDEDFAISAQKAGFEYDQLIERIATLAQ